MQPNPYFRKLWERFGEICFILSWTIAAVGRTKVVSFFLAHPVHVVTSNSSHSKSMFNNKTIHTINNVLILTLQKFDLVWLSEPCIIKVLHAVDRYHTITLSTSCIINNGYNDKITTSQEIEEFR